MLLGLIFSFFVLLISSSWASRVNVFLNLMEPLEQEVKLSFENIDLLENGNSIKLKLSKKFFSSKAPFRQLFLAGGEAPRGRYNALVLKLKEAKLNNKNLLLSTTQIKIPLRFELQKDASLSLFVFWDVKSSVKGNKFIPNFYARVQTRPLRGETVYVTCEDTDTLFAIRADTNQVMASLGVSGIPQAVVADSDNDRLFVVSERFRKLNVIELSSFRKIDSFFLPLVSSPRYIVLINSNKAAITDYRSDYVILVNLLSGGLLNSKRIGYSLSEIAYSISNDQIFISSPENQAVYVLTSNLTLVKTLRVGHKPRGLWIQNNKLYVADNATGTVNVFDLASEELVGRIRSGRGAVQVFGTANRIYISNQKEGTLSLLAPGQLIIFKKIRVGKGPFLMTVCSRRGWLYVGLKGENSLAVIDTTSEKLVGKIELGCCPFGLTVAQ